MHNLQCDLLYWNIGEAYCFYTCLIICFLQTNENQGLIWIYIDSGYTYVKLRIPKFAVMFLTTMVSSKKSSNDGDEAAVCEAAKEEP